MDNISARINKLYGDKGYMARYGLDVWITIIICFVFFVATSYYHVMNNVQPIKSDWVNQRCSPAVMPFAGLINKPTDQTAFEFTGDNFSGCIQTILQNIVGYAFQPFYYLMNLITEEFQMLANAINAVRAEFNNVRNSATDFGENTMGRALNVTMPIQQLVINAKDVFGKVSGTMASAIYTLLGSYMGLMSLFLFIIKLIDIILWILVGLIVAFWAISWIPGIGQVAMGFAIADSVIMALILIPVVIIEVLMSEIMDLSTSSPPSVPSGACFAGDTKVKLVGRKRKSFEDLEIGDVLHDGSKVTATMRLSSHQQDIYTLGGITVTGNHSVYHEDKGWIRVEKHPEACFVDDFREPYVFCVNTDTKAIKIGTFTFSDWDDLDDMDLTELRLNCPRTTPLQRDFVKKDIHKYLDAGFEGETMVEMEDGRSVPIKDVEVNDVLRFGERVCGIVVVDGGDMSGIMDYYISSGQTLSCTGNVLILDQDLGEVNTFDIEGEDLRSQKRVYHLLTDSGTFMVSGVRVGDYNTGIEKYLNGSIMDNSLQLF